jgi:hypothetical protein
LKLLYVGPLSKFAFKINLRRYIQEDTTGRCAELAAEVAAQGRAVQVDPIKPTLKAYGTKRLTLKSDEPLSNVAFKFNLRRYSKGCQQRSSDMTSAGRGAGCGSARSRQGLADIVCHVIGWDLT